jgi:hypothetical protein
MTAAKTNCRECRVEILATTAESTDGLCMPCKNGTRKNIDEGKRNYEERKKYDPWRELWTSLVKRAYAVQDGWMQFSNPERLYYAVSVLDGEVYNGGMHQFFSNSSGDLYDEALSGLRTLGAENATRLLMNAATVLFDDIDPPKSRVLRWDSMKQYPENFDPNNAPEWCERLRAIDEAYWKDPDGINDRLVEFAEQNSMIQPYIKSNEPSDAPKPPNGAF